MHFYWQEAHFFAELNALATLAIAMLLYFGGRLLCHAFPILERFCIPAAIVGGTAFALCNLVNHQFHLITLSFNTDLQTPAMAGFFACAGLNVARGGARRARRSARGAGTYFVICVILVLLQNILSMGLGALSGIGPALGLMAGSTSMVGGHGAALSFSAELVNRGISDADQVGMAAATFGLVSGCVVGGPLVSFLIRRKRIATPGYGNAKDIRNPDRTQRQSPVLDGAITLIPDLFFRHVALVALVMGSSSLFAAALNLFISGIVVPASVAAMLLGLLFGYLIKYLPWFTFDSATLDLISELMLIVFLTEASMSQQLWQLFDLALPLLTILILQVILIVAIGYFAAFPILAKTLGSRYDAAVIVGGLCGHGLGATPNALANMNAVTEQYGPSPVAYLIVPLVGGFLIDLVNIPLLLLLLNLLT